MSVPVAIRLTVTAIRGLNLVAKLGDQRIRVTISRLVGDLLGEVIALAKDEPDDADNIVGMRFVFGEDEGFGKLLAARKDLCLADVPEVHPDRTDLVVRDSHAIHAVPSYVKSSSSSSVRSSRVARLRNLVTMPASTTDPLAVIRVRRS